MPTDPRIPFFIPRPAQGDPVANRFDRVRANEMKRAEQLIREKDPTLLQGHPDIAKRNIRDVAKKLAVQSAHELGGVGGFIKRNVEEARPTNFFDLGAGSIPFVRNASPINPTLNIGNALEMVGMGPESVRESRLKGLPQGAALAMSAQPQLRMVNAISRIAPKALSASNVLRAEQVLTPALAAGATAFGTTAIGRLNGVPPVRLATDSKNPDSPGAIFSDALNQARNEFLFESGGGVLGFTAMGVLRGGATFIRGDKEFFETALESLRRAGMKDEEFALQEVSNRALISSASGTIGILPLPIIAPKFSKAKERVSAGLARQRETMFHTVSPEFSLIRRLQETDPDRHDALLREGEGNFFRQIGLARERYGDVRAGVEQGVTRGIARENLISDAPNLRVTALKMVVDRANARKVPKRTREETFEFGPLTGRKQVKKRVRTFDVTDSELDEVLHDVKAMDKGAVKLPELINLRANIRARLDSSDPTQPLSKNDRADILSLVSALDQDIDGTLAREGSEGLNALYDRLKSLDGDWITLIAGHVGNRAKRVQRTFGREKLSEATGETFGLTADERGFQRQQGVLDMEDFLDSMLSTASREEIRELGILFRSQGNEGKVALRFALARQLDRVIEPAIDTVTDAKIEVTRADVIRRHISGNDPRGKQAQRFWALTREAGVSRELVTDFTKAASQLWRQIPKDPNQFMTRSFVLSKGNPKSLLKLITGGLIASGTAGGAAAGAAGSATGPLTALLGLLTLERYAALVTSPKALKSVITLLDPKIGTGAKTRALERLASHNIFREWFAAKNVEINGKQKALANALDGLNDFQRSDPLSRMSNEAKDFFGPAR